MGRVPTVFAAGLIALGIAGCGSSLAQRPAARPDATPLSTALSYFPSDTPVVATVSTSPSAAASSLSALPSTTIERAAVFGELAKLGIDYNTEVRPLLGNPIALGIGSSAVGAGQTEFLAAWQTRSASALGRLVQSVHGLTRTGTHDGATEYTAARFAVAVDGARLLLATDVAELDTALDRNAAGDGFTAADEANDLRGLGSGARVLVVGDLATALSTPGATRALRVPWVSALRDYGVVFGTEGHQSTVRLRIQTDGRTLSAGQLPLAAGARSPGVAGVLPISVGLRDPAQVYAFVTSTLRSVAPARYRRLRGEEASAQRRSGLDVDALARSLTGDLQITSDGHTTVGRVALPGGEVAAVQRALTRPPVPGETRRALGGGLYSVTSPHGSGLVVGVVDGELVAGRATAAEVRGFAAAPTTAVPGAHGALAVRIALGQLAALQGSSDNPFMSALTAMLGDLTGSVQVTPQALTGALSVAVR